MGLFIIFIYFFVLTLFSLLGIYLYKKVDLFKKLSQKKIGVLIFASIVLLFIALASNTYVPAYRFGQIIGLIFWPSLLSIIGNIYYNKFNLNRAKETIFDNFFAGLYFPLVIYFFILVNSL